MATNVTAPEQEQGFDSQFDSVNFTDPSELIEVMTGTKPRLVAEFDLTAIDPDERVQVRIDKNNAPKEMVERFAGQMAFSVFPPIVVTQDAHIIDGNTRFRARLKREERYSPALVVPIAWEGADAKMKIRLEYLGLALNNINGKALDRVERRKMVRDALQLGMSSKQVTMTVGFPANVVSGIRRELDGEAKLERVGLEITVRDAALRALGKASDLNDKPFSELATLAADAGFNASEIGALAATVRDVGSDELALERIARERDANAQRIADRKRGGDGHPPASRVLRQRLGFIENREVSALVETNRERMQDHLGALEAAIAKLTEVVAAQRKQIAETT